jgi:hypothetical protein
VHNKTRWDVFLNFTSIRSGTASDPLAEPTNILQKYSPSAENLES